MRQGIALLNFGGPRSIHDVETFLVNLFSDRDVIQLPVGGAFQRWLARRIGRKRAPEVIEQYEAIGGGSPLVNMTFRQAEELKAELAARLGDAPPIAIGMRYTPPYIHDAARELRGAKVDRIVALGLYPHYSITTTGSSFNELARSLLLEGMGDVPVCYIPAFYTNPRYLKALADRVRQGFRKLGGPEDAHLMFSAHGLPSSYIRKGDPYQMQVQETVRSILRLLGWEAGYSLAWQSRVGPVRWLSPSIDDEIRRLGEAGVRKLLVVPVSFVGDHIETLYEIDVTYRELARSVGIERFQVAPALDTHPELIRALADVTMRALEDDNSRRVCLRCLLPREEAHHAARQCPDCRFKKPLFAVLEQQRRERAGASRSLPEKS